MDMLPHLGVYVLSVVPQIFGIISEKMTFTDTATTRTQATKSPEKPTSRENPTSCSAAEQ